MIAAITNYHHTSAASTTNTSTATSAGTSSSSFGSELQSQIELPNILQVFEGTATPSGSSSAPAAAATPAAQATTATVAPTTSTSAPTAQSVFGDQPWLQDPGGTGADGSTWDYNPIYFATPATAAQVASMVGGTVIQQNVMTPSAGSTLMQNQPNEMVQLSNGTVLNPGLIADFYDHGYSQSMVDQMIQNEIKGV